jgi:hypothetical protein
VTSAPPDPARWFASRPGRRYGRDIALLLLLKLLLLVGLWAVAVNPMPRADTSPASVARHLLSDARNAP